MLRFCFPDMSTIGRHGRVDGRSTAARGLPVNFRWTLLGVMFLLRGFALRGGSRARARNIMLFVAHHVALERVLEDKQCCVKGAWSATETGPAYSRTHYESEAQEGRVYDPYQADALGVRMQHLLAQRVGLARPLMNKQRQRGCRCVP